MIELSGAGLTVTVTPEGGARITQLTDRTGRRWLVETGRPQVGTATDPARVDFADGSRGGWDECVPSVAACRHPDTGDPVADHGDLWWRPWRVVRLTRERVTLEPAVRTGPLLARKTVTVGRTRPELRVRLAVRNTGDRDHRVLYSAHPLWRWPGDARLDVPAGGETRGAFGRVRGGGSWPHCGGYDLSALARAGVPENFKAFVRWDGRATLSFGAAVLMLSRSGGPTPWLGVCVNRDAWPPQSPGDSWIALEPTTSPTDSLVEATAAGDAVTLAGGHHVVWENTVRIRAGTAG